MDMERCNMKKTEIVLISVIVVIVGIMGWQIYQDSLKIDFLEEALSQSILEYEWLKEIKDLDDNSEFSPSLPDEFTTCGKGTTEKNGQCVPLNEV